MPNIIEGTGRKPIITRRDFLKMVANGAIFATAAEASVGLDIATLNNAKRLAFITTNGLLKPNTLSYPFIAKNTSAVADISALVTENELITEYPNELIRAKSLDAFAQNSNAAMYRVGYADNLRSPVVEYEEFFYEARRVNDNSEVSRPVEPSTKFWGQVLRIKVVENSRFNIDVEIVSDQKEQEWWFLQGGKIERGDIRFTVKSKDPAVTPSCLIIDPTELFLSGNFDMWHFMQMYVRDFTRAVSYNNGWLMTDSIGSLFPIYIDALRHNSANGFAILQRNIPAIIKFCRYLMSNAEVRFVRKEELTFEDDLFAFSPQSNFTPSELNEWQALG